MQGHEALIKLMDEHIGARSQTNKTVELTRSLKIPDLDMYIAFFTQADIACKSLTIFLSQIFIPMEIYSNIPNENLKKKVEVIKLANVFNDRSNLLPNLKATAATVDRAMQAHESFLNRVNMTDALSHYNGMRLFLNGLVSHCDQMLKDEKLEGVEDLQAYEAKQFKDFYEFINTSFTNLVINAPAYKPGQAQSLEAAISNLSIQGNRSALHS
ncbi:MAG: hypothetical protein ACHQAX_05375 [Gammaproteobacteria bacterium]